MASVPTVNLLDLAAASLASSIVAADTIKEMCKPESDARNTRLKDDGSFVTDADLAAQGIIFSLIRKVSKAVRIVGEESEEDMEGHSITGHEESSDAIFRLAQQEILCRYHRSNETPPFAQQTVSDDVPESTTSEIEGTGASNFPTSPVLEEYNVDPARVSVFIDPLDGTKAYARGEYDPVSILIAIILDRRPCFGVICKPFGHPGQTSILDTGCVAFYGGTLLGAVYTAGGSIFTLQQKEGVLPRAVISSSRSKGVVQEFVSLLGEKGMIDPEPMLVTGAGEKSLRIILRAESEGLWFFPKEGTSLWDVAASDALLRSIGGRLTDKFGHDMDYDKSRTEAENKDGVIACYDHELHAECVRLFNEGTWSTEL